MEWPAPRTGRVTFPGPDRRTVDFPGVDRQVVEWPPIPSNKSATIAAAADGVGTPTVVFAGTSVFTAAASGEGEVFARFGTTIVAAASGAGSAAAVMKPIAPVPAAVSSAGTAAVAVKPVGVVAAAASGAGTAGVGAWPSAAVDGAVTSTGTAAASVTAVSINPTFVGATTGGGVSVSSFSCAIPAGVEVGDLLVFVVRGFLAAASSTPSGWTQTAINTSRSSTSPLYVYTRIADGSESNVTISFTSANSHHGHLLAFRGVDQANPIGTTANAYRSTTSASNVTPTITPTNERSYVLRTSSCGFTSGSPTASWPAGQTELTDTLTGAGSAYGLLTTAGAVAATTAATGTVTMTSSASAAYALSIVLTLNPVAA